MDSKFAALKKFEIEKNVQKEISAGVAGCKTTVTWETVEAHTCTSEIDYIHFNCTSYTVQVPTFHTVC